jgi:hypothetical protein
VQAEPVQAAEPIEAVVERPAHESEAQALDEAAQQAPPPEVFE